MSNRPSSFPSKSLLVTAQQGEIMEGRKTCAVVLKWLWRRLGIFQAPHEAQVVPATADLYTSGFDEAVDSFHPLSSNWFGIGDRFFR
jgi:hypothetical protein